MGDLSRDSILKFGKRTLFFDKDTVTIREEAPDRFAYSRLFSIFVNTDNPKESLFISSYGYISRIEEDFLPDKEGYRQDGR